MAGRANVVRIILWTFSSCAAIEWQCSGNGQWALRCSIRSNDYLDSSHILGEECGEFCEANPKCIQFSFKLEGDVDKRGNCSLFGGRFDEVNVLTSSTPAFSCGAVISRVYPDGRSPACSSKSPDLNSPPPNNEALIIGLSLGCGAGVSSLLLFAFIRMKKMCCFRRQDLHVRTDLVKQMSTENSKVRVYERHDLHDRTDLVPQLSTNRQSVGTYEEPLYEEHMYEEPVYYETPKMKLPRPPEALPQDIFF